MASMNLTLAIQPPSEARTGQLIYPPPTITLQTARQSNGITSDDPPVLWAFVTLTGESGEVLQDQIAGTLVDSAHPFFEDGQSSSQEKNYFTFSNLCIRAPGRYRIQIALMGMGTAESSGGQGASTLAQIETRRISVSASGPMYSTPSKISGQAHHCNGLTDVAREEEALLNVIRENGEELPYAS